MPTSCSSYSLRQFTQKAHNRATVTQLPSKHAGSDPEAFRAHGQLWPLRPVQPESGRIVYVGSDLSHPIRFRSSKDRPDHIVQIRPGSDLDGLVRVWPNGSGVPESDEQAGVPESWSPVLAEFNRSATSFPLSDSVPYFHRRPG